MFAQSRRCRHQVAKRWTDALFDRLNEHPRDTIYSIAFYLSYVPLRASSKELAVAYAASSELFDLLDDYVRETDTLSVREILRDRCFGLEDFQRANEVYLTRTERLSTMFDRYLRHNSDTTAAPQSSSLAERDRTRLTVEESEEIRETFRRLDAAAAAGRRCLPHLVSMNGTEVTDSLTPLLRDVNEANDNDNSETLVLDTRSRVRGAVDFGAPFSPFETYLRYAPLRYRYDSLAPLMAAVSRARDVRIFPIYVPRGGVWQCGEAQLLWVLLHTLTALSVARANIYLARLLTLLRNMDFFIGCVECAHHWRRDRSREYFEFLAQATVHRGDISDVARRRLIASLPLDVLLARCHNRINARNSRFRRGLTLWTMCQVILDYREFVEVGLLRRRVGLYARTPPLPEGTTTTAATRDAVVKEDLLRVRCERENEADLCRDGTYRDGETLISLLWKSIDSNDEAPAGINPL